MNVSFIAVQNHQPGHLIQIRRQCLIRSQKERSNPSNDCRNINIQRFTLRKNSLTLIPILSQSLWTAHTAANRFHLTSNTVITAVSPLNCFNRLKKSVRTAWNGWMRLWSESMRRIGNRCNRSATIRIKSFANTKRILARPEISKSLQNTISRRRFRPWNSITPSAPWNTLIMDRQKSKNSLRILSASLKKHFQMIVLPDVSYSDLGMYFAISAAILEIGIV